MRRFRVPAALLLALAGSAQVIELAAVAEVQPAIIIEAEDATVVPPAAIVEASDARGGRAVCIDDGHSLVRMNTAAALDPMGLAAPRERGEALFEFDIVEPAEYAVWARLQWHCTCSQYLNVRTSGRYAGGAQDDRATGLLTSMARPQVWHWVDAGTYAFDPGPQTVRLVQRGHLALIDAIAISNEQDYRPPGYQDAEQKFVLYEPPESWHAPEQEPAWERFSERDWSDFSLNIAFPIEAGQQFGLFFCRRGERAYSLTVEASGNELAASLQRHDEGETANLAVYGEPARADVWRAVRILRAGPMIDVEINGLPAMSVEDNSFADGECGIVLQPGRETRFRDLVISPVAFHEEFFTGDALNWRPLSGIWRIAVEHNMPCYMGHGAGSALSVSPWPARNHHSSSVHARLLGDGAAGIAFDIVDETDCIAFVASANGTALEFQLLRITGGEDEVLWSHPSQIEAEQWVFLEIEKQENLVFLYADNQRLGVVELSRQDGGGPVGVFVSDGTAQFAKATFQETHARHHFAYVFEPPGAFEALAHWRRIEGVFEIQEHPGRVVVMPDQDGRTAELVWRMTIDSPVEVEMTVRPAMQRQDARANPNPAAMIPEIPLPVLPDDPRIGFALTALNAPENRLQISADLLQMRNLRVLQAGEKTAEKTVHPSTIEPHTRTISMKADGSRVTGAISGAVECSVQLEQPMWPAELSITAEYLRDTPPQITRIVVRTLPEM